MQVSQFNKQLRPAIATFVAAFLLLCGAYFIERTSAVSDPSLDAAAITHYSGIQGKLDQGVFKVEFERKNLETSVQGIELTPEFGLKAWMTLSGTRDHALLLGDLPLRQEEVAPVLRAIIDQGVSATSLHNRFTMDSSRIMSLHFEGSGNEKVMARSMGWIYSTLMGLKTTTAQSKLVKIDIKHSNLDQKKMESLLWKGEMLNGIFKVELARGTKLMNQNLGESSGANSWATFAGDGENVVVNGDIASIENELPFVIKELLMGNIQITSIHTHMTQEKPRLVYVHFFGAGKLEKIAPAVYEAIWTKEHFQSQ